MKPTVMLALLVLAASAQAQDYLDAAARSTCECSSKLPGNMTSQELKTNVGLCIIRSVMPFKDRIKADHGLDLDNVKKDGERFGQLVGQRMVQACPQTLAKLSSGSDADASAAELTVEGTVTRVEKEAFVVFTIRDAAGKSMKVWWMQSVPSSLDLVNTYDNLVGKTLKLSVQSREFFDPKVNDYRKFNVVSRVW